MKWMGNRSVSRITTGYMCSTLQWWVSRLVYGAQDPIGWELLNPIPATTSQGESYSAVYVLTSHLPFTMPTPLLVTLDASSTDFSMVDSCSGKSLTPNESCEVEVDYQPSQAG